MGAIRYHDRCCLLIPCRQGTSGGPFDESPQLGGAPIVLFRNHGRAPADSNSRSS